MQTDVTERVRVEGEREAAFAAEQAARQEAELARAIAEQARADAEQAQADAERAQSRLALMAEATSSLIATLDMAELLDRLAGLCVPLLADWVFITLRRRLRRRRADVAARHRDGRDDELARVRSRCTSGTSPGPRPAGGAWPRRGRCCSSELTAGRPRGDLRLPAGAGGCSASSAAPRC